MLPIPYTGTSSSKLLSLRPYPCLSLSVVHLPGYLYGPTYNLSIYLPAYLSGALSILLFHYLPRANLYFFLFSVCLSTYPSTYFEVIEGMSGFGGVLRRRVYSLEKGLENYKYYSSEAWRFLMVSIVC